MDYSYENNKKKRLKNILPKSGSYDFNNNNNNNSNNNIKPLTENGTIRLKETRLNSLPSQPLPMSHTKLSDSKFDLNSSFFGKIFPKYRRTLAGIPLLCLAYLSAIYTMVKFYIFYFLYILIYIINVIFYLAFLWCHFYSKHLSNN